jgi:CheY-like chemotaxis protein
MLEIREEFYLFSQDSVRNVLVAQQQQTTERARRARKPIILVVDDQHMIADTTATILNRSGFRAVHAYNGHSALDMALELKPDYLLTDIMMPGMNGVDLAIAIQKQLPATLIVLISGQAGITEILRQAKDDGHEFSLLAKPIHPEKLLEYLKKKAPWLWT